MRLYHLNRRRLLTAAPALALIGCAQGPKVYRLQVSRDDGCVCCSGWADAMEKTGRFRVEMFDAGDLPTFKRHAGVPGGFAGCHTALVENYVIEGHVPPADVLRLLEEKPAGVLGLVVAGMPRGSPGMEQENGQKDEFIVYAFKAGEAKYEFAVYPGSA